MKILQINTWYPRLSTGKLVKYINDYLISTNNESYVLFGRGVKLQEKNILKCCSTLESKINSVLSRLTGVMYGGNYFSTKKFLNEIKRINPDIVHIHCTNSFIINNFKLFSFLGKNNYKVVITLHAEYLYTGGCGNSLNCNKWKTGCGQCPNLKYATRSIFKDKTNYNLKTMCDSINTISIQNRRIVAVSDWVKNRAKQSIVFKNDDIITINNGIDENIFNCQNITKVQNNSEYLCLYLTPNFKNTENDVKGSVEFLKLAASLSDQKIHFIVAGKNTSNYDFSKHKNITYIGEVKTEQKLADLYNKVDLTLLLSKSETFSMVTAESISCGTPVVGYQAGGPETIACPPWGTFVKQGDIKALKTVICSKLDKLQIKDKRKDYSKNEMCKKYINVYKDLI